MLTIPLAKLCKSQLTPNSPPGSPHSSNRSASSSVDRYQLDESNGRPILVYIHQGEFQKWSQKQLFHWLEESERRGENFRLTKKPIPRLQLFVDVKQHDLYSDDEKEQYRELPNYNLCVASIKIPYLAYFVRLLPGKFDRLYIVSPWSPPRSVAYDRDNRGSEEDVVAGAEREPPAAPYW